jgi:hypothetical protein
MTRLNLDQIEKFVKENLENQLPTHGFGHLQRTAKGAGWFAKVFGRPSEEQEIAYLAGLIHDLKRPPTEKIDHTGSSVREAEKILTKFSINKEIAQKVLKLISLHREFSNAPLSSQWVFLADKILEQSGAFLIFRRSYYVGECEDFKNLSLFEATLPYWEKRTTKFPPDKFHLQTLPLAYYQYKWNKDFCMNIAQKKPWAVKLAKTFFDFGRQKKKNLEQLIKDYEVDDNNTRVIKKEALDYLSGKKYSEFATLLKI